MDRAAEFSAHGAPVGEHLAEVLFGHGFGLAFGGEPIVPVVFVAPFMESAGVLKRAGLFRSGREWPVKVTGVREKFRGEEFRQVMSQAVDKLAGLKAFMPDIPFMLQDI